VLRLLPTFTLIHIVLSLVGIFAGLVVAGGLVRGGVPMRLTGTGHSVRRSLVLILQNASQPRSMLAPDWTPVGLCAP
jgi:hypothetical protein